MSWEDALSQAYVDTDPEEVAAFLERLDPSAVAEYLQSLSPQPASLLFGSLSPASASEAFRRMDRRTQSMLLEEAPIDVCNGLVRRLPESESAALLNGLSKPRSSALKSVLAYPASSAGGLMDPEYPAVMSDMTVSEAIAILRRCRCEHLGDIFVLDRQLRLLGAIALSDLLLGEQGASAGSLAEPFEDTLSPFADAKSLLESPALQSRRALPVVANSRVYLGALSHALLLSKTLKPDASGKRANRDEAAAELAKLFKLGVGALASFVEEKGSARATNRSRNPETQP